MAHGQGWSPLDGDRSDGKRTEVRSEVIGRATPGPMGAYVVAVGYQAAGVRGAIAGWLALVTPAFVALPLLVTVQRWLHLPRVRALVDAVVIAGATMLIPAAALLAFDGAAQLLRLLP